MLIQKMNQDAGISNQQIKSLIMPFSTSGVNSQLGVSKFGGPSFIGSNVFNNKVFKPIRGGGLGDQ